MKFVSFFTLICFLTPLHAWAQFNEADAPSPGFLFPIKPGNPASLAGTMGELRSTHFHTGIDIRTNNQIGWPVLASAPGYVSRATVTPAGFGLALYVKHPNGYTTVYGHLDRFRKDIHDYVRQERYRRKSSTIDLYFRKNQFPVNQGDTIAFAGNTGTSAGPHLHFDIRDEDNHALDPAAFSFAEIIDKTPPVVRKIALRPLDKNSRINDEFGRVEFYVTKTGNQYQLNEPVLAWGNVGLEVLAYDIVDHPAYKCGVNYIEVSVNEKIIFQQSITRLNPNEGRQVFTATNFAAFRESGNMFYKLYVDFGNQLPFYQSLNRGIIEVKDEEPVKIQIRLSDLNGNASSMNLTLKPSRPPVAVKWLEPVSEIQWTTDRNVWKITAPTCPVNALAWKAGDPQVIEAAYLNSASTVYLLDLRKPLPDSIVICGKRIIPPFKAIIPPQADFRFTSEAIDVRFGKQDLFDTLYFTSNVHLRRDSSVVFQIGDKRVPLKQSVEVTLKPASMPAIPDKTAAYRINGKGFVYMGGNWKNNSITFTTRDWGEFVILTDSIAPVITPLQINRNEIRLRIRDDLSGIKDYQATLNGQWLLLNYDEKTRTLQAEPLIPRTAFKGELIVSVKDNSGNEQTYKQLIP